MYEKFEKWLNTFIDNIDVDLMPGAQDFSNAYLPQQPINSYLFPQLSDKEQINFVTNPHKFEMAGIEFLGMSGQNLHDL